MEVSACRLPVPEQCAAPGIAWRAVGTRLVARLGQIEHLRGERFQRTAPRVVHHDVEDHADPPSVARLHEELQIDGVPHVDVGSKEEAGAVSPVQRVGRILHGQQLDRVDAEIGQVRQPLEQRLVEGAEPDLAVDRIGRRIDPPHRQLVDDNLVVIGQLHAGRNLALPVEGQAPTMAAGHPQHAAVAAEARELLGVGIGHEDRRLPRAVDAEIVLVDAVGEVEFGEIDLPPLGGAGSRARQRRRRPRVRAKVAGPRKRRDAHRDRARAHDRDPKNVQTHRKPTK